MEEQVINAAEQTQDVTVNQDVAEESQPEVLDTDVVSEEELDVVEKEPEVESEPAGEEPQQAEEDLPFNQRPGVKERLGEIEEKYSSKAQYWDTIASIAQTDPEFRIAVLERLEASGRLPEGTVEAEKAKLSSFKESDEYVKGLPEDVQEDLRAARELRVLREQEEVRSRQEADKFFVDFESSRPEIASSSNPSRTRSLIFQLANEIADREGVELPDAMDRAYRTILKPNAEQNATVAQKVSQVQSEGNVAPMADSPSKGRLRRLTQDEKRAAEIAGMTPEEYIKYSDSTDEELFENI
jgi:hypothetical protein